MTSLIITYHRVTRYLRKKDPSQDKNGSGPVPIFSTLVTGTPGQIRDLTLEDGVQLVAMVVVVGLGLLCFFLHLMPRRNKQ